MKNKKRIGYQFELILPAAGLHKKRTALPTVTLSAFGCFEKKYKNYIG